MAALGLAAAVALAFTAVYLLWRARGRFAAIVDGGAAVLEAVGRVFGWAITAVARLIGRLGSRLSRRIRRGPVRRLLFEPYPTERRDTRPPPSEREEPGPLRLLTVSILLLLVAGVTLQQMNGLLAGMHTPEEPSVGMSGFVGSSPEEMGDAVCTWRRWEQARLGDPVGPEACPPLEPGEDDAPGRVVNLHVLVDTILLVPAYVVVAGFALMALRRRTSPRWTRDAEAIAARSGPGAIEETILRRQADVRSNSTAWSRVSMVLTLLLVLGAVADVAENVLTWLTYQYRLEPRVGPWSPGVGQVALVAANSAKTWLLALTALGIGYVALLGPVADRTARGLIDGVAIRLGRVWRGVLALRVPSIAVAMLAALFLVKLGSFSEQFEDVIRRWNVVHAIAALYLILWVAVLVWASGRTIAERVWGNSTRPASDPRLRRAVVALLVGAALIQLALHVPFGADAGLGLVIPAAFAAGLGLIGRPLSSKHAGTTGSGRIRVIPRWLPRLLAAAIPVIIGLAVVRAGVAELLLSEGRAYLRWWLVAFPAAVLVLIVPVTSLAKRFRARVRSKIATAQNSAVAWVAGTLGVFLVGLWLLEGSAWDLESGILRLTDRTLVPLGILLVVLVGYSVFYILEESKGNPSPLVVALSGDTARDRRRRLVFGAAAFAFFVTSAWLVAEPLEFAPALGTIAIILLFFAGLVAALFGLTEFAERTEPPRALTWMGFRRTPMVLGFVAWIAVASMLPANGFHDVPIVDASELPAAVAGAAADEARADLAACLGPAPEDRLGVDIAFAFRRWVCRQDVAGIDGGARRAVPLVIVSSWGGGIRAAVWTALAMDCVFEPLSAATEELCRPGGPPDAFDRSDRFFAGSGISGGALGLLAYQAYLDEKLTSGANQGWIRARLTGDYLAPTFGRMLFTDFPMRLSFLTSAVADRGDILEQAWEKSWDGGTNRLQQGLFASYADNPKLPLIVANGTSINDRCSLNASVLDNAVRSTGLDDCESLEPFAAPPPGGLTVGTRDLADYLCAGRDVRLSSAALLSARFAFISPSGRVAQPDECTQAPRRPDAFVVDGGYLEGSGTVTAFQIWDAIEPLVAAHNADGEQFCIVPVMVHLENGYRPPRRDDSQAPPNEWIAPLGNYNRGLVSNARQRIALEFSQPLIGSGGATLQVSDGGQPLGPRFAFVTTRAHPGVQAPLGWTLSESAVADLESQLAVNDTPLAVIDAWFSETLICE